MPRAARGVEVEKEARSGVLIEQKFSPSCDWPWPSSSSTLPFKPRPTSPFLDNFPHAGSGSSKLAFTPSTQSPLHAIAICLQLFSFSLRHIHIPLQDVPERPPTEHARRRRPLCHQQSRRSELKPIRPSAPENTNSIRPSSQNNLNRPGKASVKLN